MSKRFHPIPKWKSIVGTVSSGVIMAFGLFFLLLSTNIDETDNVKTAISIIGLVVTLVGGIFLFINLVLFRMSVMERNRLAKINNQADSQKVETLHRLLKEGKITIEEYDALMKK